MAEVPVAASAQNLRPPHAVADVGVGGDVFLRNGLEEAGPARAGIELGVGGEERQVAADAGVDAGLLVIIEGSAEGAFGPLAARDLVLFLGQLRPPLLVGLDDFVHGLKLGRFAVLVEQPHLHLPGLEAGGRGRFDRGGFRAVAEHRAEDEQE